MEDIKRAFHRTPVTLILIVLNTILFFLVDLTGGTDNSDFMIRCGASCRPFIWEQKEYWRWFTAMFLHFGIEHLVYNMLTLFVMGNRLEHAVGKWKYLMIYLLGGMAGNIVSTLQVSDERQLAVSAGASGAIFALVGGLLFLLLRDHGRVEDLNTNQLLTMAVMSTILGFMNNGVDNAAHLGGMAGGFLIAALLCFRDGKSRNMHKSLL